MIPSALDGKVTDKSCSEIYAPEDVVFEGKNKLLPSLPLPSEETALRAAASAQPNISQI